MSEQRTSRPISDAPESGAPEARAGEILVVGDRLPIVQSLGAALSGLGLPVGVMVEPGLDGTPPLPSGAGGGIAVLDAALGAPGEAAALTRSLTDAGWLVLVLAAPGDPLPTAACLDAGAVAHLPATSSLEVVASAVSELSVGGETVRSDPERDRLLALLRESRSASARMLRPFERLTRRESQVLQGLMAGSGPDQIAEADFVSPATVRNQIQAVLTKLGVRSRLEAVALAARSGWPPDSVS